jgi:aryl-alcohol dehydrogenase-like predicted oxidoreductase
VRYRRTQDGSLEVSIVGVGTYALAGVYGEKDPAVIRRILRAAYDRGVTLFDTAPAYGEAEEVLGQVLKDVRPSVVISTKVPACLGDVSCSYDSLIAACDRSLERMGVDYIDLYQIHFDDGMTPVDEVVRAFEDLKALGKIRAYGIGHVSEERAAEYVKKGSPSTIMGELSAVSRNYYVKILPILKASRAGFIGFSLTGRGMLTSGSVDRKDLVPGDIRQMDAVFAGERRQSGLRIREEFGRVGGEIGATVAQIAIAWAISQVEVLTGLIGPSTPEHLEEDLRGAELRLDRSVMERLDGFLAREAARLAGKLKAEILSILDEDIKDTEQGASSLVYAMEGLAELGLAREEDLVSNMGKVIKIMKSGEGGLSALDAIRRDLVRHVGTA